MCAHLVGASPQRIRLDDDQIRRAAGREATERARAERVRRAVGDRAPARRAPTGARRREQRVPTRVRRVRAAAMPSHGLGGAIGASDAPASGTPAATRLRAR